MAIDARNNTLVMPSTIGAYEAQYDEKYVFWMGPLNRKSKRITHHAMQDSLLVDFSDIALAKYERDQAKLIAANNAAPKQTAVESRSLSDSALDIDQNMAQQSQNDLQSIQQTLTSWLRAWEASDIANYLDHYSPGFIPPIGVSRALWKEQRTFSLTSEENVQIALSEVQVNVSADGLSSQVVFLQQYRSSTGQEDSVKLLELVRENERWLIRREEVQANAGQ